MAPFTQCTTAVLQDHRHSNMAPITQFTTEVRQGHRHSNMAPITQFTKQVRTHFATDCHSVRLGVQPLIGLMAKFC